MKFLSVLLLCCSSGLLLSHNLSHALNLTHQISDASSDEYFELVEMTIEALEPDDERYDHLFPGLMLESVASDCSGQKRLHSLNSGVGTNPPQRPAPSPSRPPQSGASNGGIVAVDQIISTGERVWKIVEANRPVVHSQLPRAHALPRGVSCWTDLQMWSIPRTQDFKITYRNGFGVDVIDFVYRVSYTSGGNFENQGAFLSNVSVQAATLNVSWGFTFHATAQVGQVVNLGTNDDPLAGMEMIVNWKAGSVLRHMESTQSVFVSGDGVLRKL